MPNVLFMNRFSSHDNNFYKIRCIPPPLGLDESNTAVINYEISDCLNSSTYELIYLKSVIDKAL